MRPLDRAVLASLADDLGDPQVVREVVRLYLELLPERREALLGAARTADRVRVRREAHTLGSASAVVGAAELRALCRTLETTELPTEAAPLARLLDGWATTCARAADALAAWLDEA